MAVNSLASALFNSLYDNWFATIFTSNYENNDRRDMGLLLIKLVVQ